MGTERTKVQTIHAGKDGNWTHGTQSNPANSNSQGKRRIVRVNEGLSS
jgi:hypothetical protein